MAKQPSSTSSPYASITAFTDPLGEPFDLSVQDFNGAIDFALHEGIAEHHVERVRKVVAEVLRIVLRKKEVHQIADLERLGGAIVGHVTSSTVRLVVVIDQISVPHYRRRGRVTQGAHHEHGDRRAPDDDSVGAQGTRP
jgi:hypothetical protein